MPAAYPEPVAREELSLAAARRVALAAQGFLDPRPAGGRPDRRHLRRVLGRVGVLQIDAVNVLARAHYLPLFSRLGPYPVRLLDEAAYAAPRELFEYWGHEASLLPVGTEPLLRWRMKRAGEDAWGRMVRISREHPGIVERVLAEVAARGPVTASVIAADLGVGARRRGPWWGWGEVKTALEYLFWAGRVTTHSRTPGFERRYDLPERVLPAGVRATPTPPDDAAQRGLLRIAAGCLGVATTADLADYFRIRVPQARPRVAELVEAGTLQPVRVRGWRDTAYVVPGTPVPRRVPDAALVGPFDPLVWARDRVQRLFGARVRLEIYVPAAQRVHGYYVLPLLVGDRVAARVDLKADRRAGVLRAVAAYAEPGEERGAVAARLAGELGALAGWLGLGAVAAGPRGDLAAELGGQLRERFGT